MVSAFTTPVKAPPDTEAQIRLLISTDADKNLTMSAPAVVTEPDKVPRSAQESKGVPPLS